MAGLSLVQEKVVVGVAEEKVTDTGLPPHTAMLSGWVMEGLGLTKTAHEGPTPRQPPSHGSTCPPPYKVMLVGFWAMNTRLPLPCCGAPMAIPLGCDHQV